MKKIVALIMVLSMLLSGTAFAEKTSTQTMAQIYINPQVVAGADEAVLTLVDTINSLVFTTTKGENVVTVGYGANDVAIGEYTVASTEDGGLLFFNSLYPNTAILLDFAKVAALIQQYLPMDVEEWLIQAQGAAAEIGSMLMPYASDISNLMATLESQIVVDESNMSAYLSITTQHLGQLIYDLTNRLSSDEMLQSVLSVMYDQLMQNEYNAPSLSEVIAQLKQEAEGLKNSEAMEIATLGIYQGEDGSVCYELTVANQLLVSVDAYTYEGMDCIDLMVIACSGTDNWQEVYDGICNGTNYNDVLFGLDLAMAGDYTYAQLYMIQSGSAMALTLEETVENAGTDDETITTVASLDMSEGDQTINLGGFAAETVLVDDHTMPSLEDKYVLDVLALPIDVLMNGLPQLVEGVVNGMPEMVNLVLETLSQVEGLEFLQMFTVPVPEEPAEIAEPIEVVPSANEDVIDEVAPATTNVTTDDEIAPHEETKMDGMIEDL